MAVLECKDLSKHYGNAPALNHVSLAVEPGRIVGLLGPSSKTTHPHQAGQRPADPSEERCWYAIWPWKGRAHASVSYLPGGPASPLGCP